MAHSREQLVDSLGRVVADERVLDALAAVDRAAFVPERLRDRAWEDSALPIGRGQTISQPRVVARMCELLELRGDENVLDVGTGSGYHAAVLAQLGAQVWSIEREQELSEAAGRALSAAGVTNVELVVGDGSRGLPDEAPFDAINVAAATPARCIPGLAAQLAGGGRLVAPQRNAGERIVRLRRDGLELQRTEHEAVRFVPLVEG